MIPYWLNTPAGRSRLLDAFLTSDMVVTRITLAIAEFLWALTLFWPGTTFDRPTYDIMSKVMGETAWAFTFLLTAHVQLSIVLIGGCRSWYANGFAAWNAVLWIFCAVSMYLSVYPPPAAISGETALALAAFGVFIRPFAERVFKR